MSIDVQQLEEERAERQKDLLAFSTAYNVIKRRLLDVSEETPEREAMLQRWAGTWACIGSLELAMQAIERTIKEIDELLIRVQHKKGPN